LAETIEGNTRVVSLPPAQPEQPHPELPFWMSETKRVVAHCLQVQILKFNTARLNEYFMEQHRQPKSDDPLARSRAIGIAKK